MQKIQKSFPTHIFTPECFDKKHYLINIVLPSEMCEFSYHAFGDKNFQEQGKITIVQQDELPIIQSLIVNVPQSIFIQWYSKDEDEEFFFFQFIYPLDFLKYNKNFYEPSEKLIDSENVSIVSMDDYDMYVNSSPMDTAILNKNIMMKIEKKDLTEEEKEKNKMFFKSCIDCDANDVIKTNKEIDSMLSNYSNEQRHNINQNLDQIPNQQTQIQNQQTQIQNQQRQITNIDDFRKQFYPSEQSSEEVPEA